MEKKAALNLEEEIADLNDKIRGYETKLENAEADNRSDREERYTALINKARGTLDNLILLQREERQLLAQQQQQQTNPASGNYFFFLTS
jgi:hypothetical protein